MPRISATVRNEHNLHDVQVTTGDNTQSLVIAPKSSGYGSSMNGAEALLLALATCYCNDLYREAAQRGIHLSHVEVSAQGEYDGVSGHPIERIVYRTRIEGDASGADLTELAHTTDSIAEIHNTLRRGAAVTLEDVQVATTG